MYIGAKIALKHIELFAGCGGMSIGLEAAKFELYLANELSPMAGETFSYNLIGENLNDLAKRGSQAKNVLWIQSNFDKASLRSRLRENPFTFDNGKYSDLIASSNLKGKLLIGNVDHLLSYLEKNKSLCKKLQDENIDLISGGPPCQSFSLAGRREKDNHKNLLPLSFARFAGIVKPKMVLLENVKGITSPFTVEGKKYYAWIEVAKAFSLEGFVPVCMMVNSKYFGIPQNRPRFILIGLRRDICEQLLKIERNDATLNILTSSLAFFNLVHKNKNSLENVTKDTLMLYDIEKHETLFDGNFFPQITTKKENFVSSMDAIDDLCDSHDSDHQAEPSKYVSKINKLFRAKFDLKNDKAKNHELRKHSFGVKARFRWFQILSGLNGLTPYGLKLLSGQYANEEKIDTIFDKIKEEKLLVKDGVKEKLRKLPNENAFIDYIKSIQTKKHSQRALRASEPAPAQLTIPDDLCHYSPYELRTLTVREMARFQSFPDWFEFRSKVTTGGNQRSFEVPQYTQVGNAVPPLLAYELGKTISKILTRIKNG